MKRHELLILIAVAIACIATGFTWWLHYYGLIGCGAALLVSTFLIDVKEE